MSLLQWLATGVTMIDRDRRRKTKFKIREGQIGWTTRNVASMFATKAFHGFGQAKIRSGDSALSSS